MTSFHRDQKLPKRAPAHPGLASIDPFGAIVVIVSTIVPIAYFFHDTPVQYIVAAVLAFYAIVALVIAVMCRKGKVSIS